MNMDAQAKPVYPKADIKIHLVVTQPMVWALVLTSLLAAAN